MTITSGGVTDATARYIIAGWFEDHADDKIRADYIGALDLGRPYAFLANSGRQIGLGDDGAPNPCAVLSVDFVQDATVVGGRLLLVLANGDDLDLGVE